MDNLPQSLVLRGKSLVFPANFLRCSLYFLRCLYASLARSCQPSLQVRDILFLALTMFPFIISQAEHTLGVL